MRFIPNVYRSTYLKICVSLSKNTSFNFKKPLSHTLTTLAQRPRKRPPVSPWSARWRAARWWEAGTRARGATWWDRRDNMRRCCTRWACRSTCRRTARPTARTASAGYRRTWCGRLQQEEEEVNDVGWHSLLYETLLFNQLGLRYKVKLPSRF